VAEGGAQVGRVITAPADADQTRRALFRARLLRPFAIALPAAIFTLGAFGEAGPLGAAAFAVAVYAVIAYRAFRWSDRTARERFVDGYASARGLARLAEPVLPPVTPLLSIGDTRYAEAVMQGELPGGLHGILAFHTYEDHRRRDGKSGRLTTSHPFTVVVHHLPEVTERVLQLFCEPRTRGRRSSSGVEGFRRAIRLQLESVALDERYEIFYGPGDDESFLHQLHPPTFIVWLAEQAPTAFAYQLNNGYLSAFVPGHHYSAERLDALCAAAATVSRRLVDRTRA
jgi:hypothetical protein